LRLRQRGEDQHVVEFDATLSGAGFGGAPEIFNGDSGLGVELAKGAANRMTGTAVAARFAPCILHQWQSGDRVHLLVVEVR
jgi:hypothetical protein